MLGGGLIVVGVWQVGIWRTRIRAEGGGLVVAVGTAVSTLGFLASNLLPLVSITSAEIGFPLGVVGSALLVLGVVKLSAGQSGLSTRFAARPASSWWKKPAWSRKEWFALLTAMLVTASVLAFASSINQGLCGCGLVSPRTTSEELIVESYTFNSPTNVTLNIRNVGTAYATMIAYYVKDSAGDRYSNTSWSGPTAAPNLLVHANILIEGNAFTFQTGNSYTIIVITSRNNQFTFTVVL